MSYLEMLKEENSKTKTLNGAVTYSKTGDACLDLFSVAGGMRYRNPKDAIGLFKRAYIENPDLAMKLLFYIRDIRQGMGERRVFRTLLRYVAKMWPESARKNVDLIAEYGRFDDLLCLQGTKVWPSVVDYIKKVLSEDLKSLEARKNGELDAHISLLAKWLPSVNTSSKKTCAKAMKLANDLGMPAGDYRKMLSKLRAQIGIAERNLSGKRVENIKYEAVPAGAMLKYRNAFADQDSKRFFKYLTEVKKGTKSIHCETLFPYEIVRPIFRYGIQCEAGRKANLLDVMWNSLPADIGNENAISVIDVSGSMYCGPEGAVTPALIAQSLGLYHAERAKGAFHNHFITFSSEPELIEIHGKTLRDKLAYIQSADWGMSTNIKAVFNLILNTAVKNKSTQEEMPSVLYIISDMEFDCAIENPSMTVYDGAKKKFNDAGYELPAVVFINVNSWQMQAPVRAHTKGAALVSGAGINSFKHKFDGNMTPMSHMLMVLNSDRYKKVCA